MQSEVAADVAAKSAAQLESETSVRNKCLSEPLRMGTPRGVSSNLSAYEKRKPHCRKLKHLTLDV